MFLSLEYLLEVHARPTEILKTVSVFRIIKRKYNTAQIICMDILYPRIALISVSTFAFGFTIIWVLNNTTLIDMAGEERSEAMWYVNEVQSKG